MATARRNEQRALDAGEVELVEATHHPALGEAADRQVQDLVKRLRERRDRARSLADKQRRSVRGKGPVNTTSDHADAGNREKARVLSAALARVNKELSRRRAAEKSQLVKNAQQALASKKAKTAPARPDRGQTPGQAPVEGDSSIENTERSS